MREKDVKHKLKVWLKARPDILVFSPIPQYQIGIHDFILCIHGRFISVEAKGSGGRMTAHQQAFARKVERANGIWFELRPDNLDALLRELELLYDEPDL